MSHRETGTFPELKGGRVFYRSTKEFDLDLLIIEVWKKTRFGSCSVDRHSNILIVTLTAHTLTPK